MFLNGGPEFTLNPSISFFVYCETEEETDKIWGALLKDKESSVLMPLGKYEWSAKYGWIKDKFGITWQLFLGIPEDAVQKVTPVLMFTEKQNGKAEQAIHFYTSVFKESKINSIYRYSRGENDVEGTLKHAEFKLSSYAFMAMDSSLKHNFSFNEAISFVVECQTQNEIDYLWNAFTEEGEEGQCGWLKDKFGVSWQIVPVILKKLMSDPSRSERVVSALLQMKKLEIKQLLNA